MAENKAPRTIATYMSAADELGAFLADHAMPSVLAKIRREHVETWLGDLLSRHKAATASVRFRAVQQFFRWAVEEGEIEQSPMARMHPPIIPEEPPPVLAEDALRKLLASMSGKSFADRRDTALIALLIDTGVRRAECAGLRVEDVDLSAGQATVLERDGGRASWLSGERQSRRSIGISASAPSIPGRPTGVVARPRRPDDRLRHLPDRSR